VFRLARVHPGIDALDIGVPELALTE